MVVRRGWLRYEGAFEPGPSSEVEDEPSFQQVLEDAGEGEDATCCG